MQTTNDMGLVVWDDLDDPYDHTELAANWIKVDDHDHTAGKGKQIPSGGLAEDSVTQVELAPDSVTTVEILNHTILGEDIADGAVGADQLDPNLFAALLPLGSVIPWYRPNDTFAVPTGFVLCAGGTLIQANHDWAAAGTIDIPDLRDRFIIGAGTGVAERATGGSNSRTYAHSHTIPNHTHNVAGHTHTTSNHSHQVNSHSHGIVADGSHSHLWMGGYQTYQRPYHIGTSDRPIRQALYIANYNYMEDDNVLGKMDYDGLHSHGGSTGGSAPGTTANGAGTTSSTGLVTATVNGTLNTSSASPGGDTRPAYYGLLYIMKVKKRTI